MKKRNKVSGETTTAVTCFRCGSPIVGKFYVVEGKFIGPGCYETLQRRNRIRAQEALPLQKTIKFIETALCKCSCLNCQFLLSSKCPQEKEFKGILGRRR